MKVLILALTLLFSLAAFGKDCEVYGISDSPQKLSCSFPGHQIKLSCKKGIYYLNSQRVSVAYHLEVEDGPVPLVFKTKKAELVVLIEAKTDIFADLELNGQILKGSCI